VLASANKKIDLATSAYFFNNALLAFPLKKDVLKMINMFVEDYNKFVDTGNMMIKKSDRAKFFIKEQ
jgi:hypothetical protein